MKLNGEYATMYRETSSAGANSKEIAVQTEEVEDEKAADKEEESEGAATTVEERAVADSVEASFVAVDASADAATESVLEVAASER